MTLFPKTLSTRTATALLIGLASTATTASADIVWTGTGSDANLLFGDDNYDFSGPSVTAVDPGTAVLDNLTYADATIVPTDFGTFASGSLNVGDGFTITLDNTTLTAGDGNDGILGAAGGSETFLNLINGSELAIGFLNNQMTTSVDGTSHLILIGTGNPLNNDSIVNLDLGGQITFGNEAELNEHAAKLFVGGVDYATDSSILSFVTNGDDTVTATAVPEPTSLALLGLGGLLVARRRRGK